MNTKEKFTTEQLRNILKNPKLQKQLRQIVDSSGLPPRPSMPDGVPKDFLEVLYTKGIASIPLRGDNNGWDFACFMDGTPIIDSRTGNIISFPTYEEAMDNLRRYEAYLKGKTDQR